MRRNTPRKTPAQQQVVLARRAKSGLSAAEFCRILHYSKINFYVELSTTNELAKKLKSL